MQKTALFRLSVTLCLLHSLCVGCVRRRLLVRTNPAGASVYVDKQLIGTSPIATSTTFYGTREIEVVGDGYRTEKVFRKFNPPWYQIPPLDFFTETLWPWELRDERIVDITLVPNQIPASEELQTRAEGLRLQASQGLAVPLPPTLQNEADFGNPAGQPGSPPPARPLDPTFDPGLDQPIVGSGPATQPIGQGWRPGQILGEILRPGGQSPTRIPEAGILPGGGLRPELPQ